MIRYFENKKVEIKTNFSGSGNDEHGDFLVRTHLATARFFLIEISLPARLS